MKKVVDMQLKQTEKEQKTILDLLNKTNILIKEIKIKYETAEGEKKEELKRILDDLEERLKKYIRYNKILTIREEIRQRMTLWSSVKTLELEEKIKYYEELAALFTKEPLVNKKEIILDNQIYVIDSDFEQIFIACYKNVIRLRKEQFIKSINDSNNKIQNKHCRFELDKFANLGSADEKLRYCRTVKNAIQSSPIEEAKEISVNQKTVIIDRKYELPFILVSTLLPHLEKAANFERPFQKQIDYYKGLMKIIFQLPITNEALIELGDETYSIEKDYAVMFITCYNKIVEIQVQMKRKRPCLKYLKEDECIFVVDYYLALKTTEEKLKYCKCILKEIEENKKISNPKNVVNQKGEEIPISNKHEITYNLLLELVEQLEYVYAEERKLGNILKGKWVSQKEKQSQKREEKARRKEEFKDDLIYYKKQINILLNKLMEYLSKVTFDIKNDETSISLLNEDGYILPSNYFADNIDSSLQSKNGFIYPINYFPEYPNEKSCDTIGKLKK